MNYVQVSITVTEEHYELITAELLAAGYDSFSEDVALLEAYVDKELFDEAVLAQLVEKYSPEFAISYTFGDLENKNWNAEWESNFQPVTVADKCIVRASFHEADKKYDYDIVINPKMSFGTGHHETTHMMLEHLLNLDVKNKIVMDAGSGTGILAILASMIGATHVTAFDIEDWAFENAKENTELNNCANITVLQGTVSSLSLPYPTYDIVLANINKNVLLEEISLYYKFLNPNGLLVLSGFYESDIPDLDKKALELTYRSEKINVKNHWASIIYRKA